MDDLGTYVGKPGYIMLGGGNPARIPAIEAYFQQATAHLLEDEERFKAMIGPATQNCPAWLVLTSFICLDIILFI